MLKLIKLIVLLVALNSTNRCSRIKSESMPLQIRILNNTQYDFSDLKLTNYTIGELKSGIYSDYVRLPYGYSYDQVYFKIENDEFEQIPIDYVGENKLKSGNYTYSVSIDSYEDRLFLIKLIND